jgi:hypothetical protein
MYVCMPVSEWLMNFGLNQTQPYKKNGVVSCVYGGRRGFVLDLGLGLGFKF